MDYFCTPCCKNKRRDEAALPAIERYQSERIAHVYRESQRARQPLLILSGKYGLLEADEEIPWYDQPLTMEGITGLVLLLAGQLPTLNAEKLIFYARSKTTPGWQPYHAALEIACRQAGVALVFVDVNGAIAE